MARELALQLLEAVRGAKVPYILDSFPPQPQRSYV